MCGIAGLIGRNSDAATLARQATAMAATLHHRGPDDCGVWVHPEAGVALAHRRLAIIDLSPAGTQPMVSPSGSWLVFNGEIYNFPQLRGALERESSVFRGGSDTEVLLAALDRWGVDGALKQVVGMFAFAWWQEGERTLTLGRDRMGEKPLCYGWLGDDFVFASELRALRTHPGWHDDLNREAVALQLRYGYIPAPHSIQRGIYKLTPGSWLRIPVDLTAATARGRFSTEAESTAAIRPRRYWSLADTARHGVQSPPALPPILITDELERHLRNAVRGQLRSDVPLGAFLSGGIDSSTVVALMQAESDRPVRTFSIGFSDTEFDESHHAAAVARHLGTDHTAVRLDEHAALDLVPDLAQVYDEPFADASQLPTLLVARLARRDVTVVLTGDGGDELFGGYNRYRWVDATWRIARHLPPPVRRLGRRLLPGPARLLDRWFTAGPPGGVARPTSPGQRLHRLASLLSSGDRAGMYQAAIACWGRDGVMRDTVAQPPMSAGVFAPPLNYIEQMMLWDGLHYLPDDNLVKVDRATMAIALEARLPLLDHRVVEFAWRIPAALRNAGGMSKWPLRQILYRHVPSQLIDRPKMGFSVPVGRWLQGPLREWAESLLDPVGLRDEGLFDVETVRTVWDEHLAGRRNHQSALWAVLMFQAWRRTHAGAPASARTSQPAAPPHRATGTRC